MYYSNSEAKVKALGRDGKEAHLAAIDYKVVQTVDSSRPMASASGTSAGNLSYVALYPSLGLVEIGRRSHTIV